MFRTFQEVEKSKITIGRILFFLMVLSVVGIILLLILAFLPQFYRLKDFFMYHTFTLNMILVGLIFVSAVYYVGFRNRTKNKYLGELIFKNDGLVINERNFLLSEIKSIRIIGNDIKGEFRGFVSKGSQNKIILKTINQEEVHTFFEQTTENNLRQIREILDVYYKMGILSESNFHNICNNTNYY